MSRLSLRFSRKISLPKESLRRKDSTFEVRSVGVETHQFHGLVVASGGHQPAVRGPREAIYGALVMLRSLEENGGLIRLMILSGGGKKRKHKDYTAVASSPRPLASYGAAAW